MESQFSQLKQLFVSLCLQCNDAQLVPVRSVFSEEDVRLLRLHNPDKTNAVMDNVWSSEGKLLKVLLAAGNCRKHLHSSEFNSNIGHFVMCLFSSLK